MEEYIDNEAQAEAQFNAIMDEIKNNGGLNATYVSEGLNPYNPMKVFKNSEGEYQVVPNEDYRDYLVFVSDAPSDACFAAALWCDFFHSLSLKPLHVLIGDETDHTIGNEKFQNIVKAQTEFVNSKLTTFRDAHAHHKGVEASDIALSKPDSVLSSHKITSDKPSCQGASINELQELVSVIPNIKCIVFLDSETKITVDNILVLRPKITDERMQSFIESLPDLLASLM